MNLTRLFLLSTFLFVQAQFITETEFFQQINMDIQIFPYASQQASPSFKLSVRMDDTQERISLYLQDYLGGYLYFDLYYIEDIQERLTPKQTIIKVFSMLSRSPEEQNENKMYFLGTRTDSDEEGYCFSVEEGGIIKIYHKETVLEQQSVFTLKLIKIRLLTGVEELEENILKSVNQIREQNQIFESQIEQLKHENFLLIEENNNLVQEVKEIQNAYSQINQQKNSLSSMRLQIQTLKLNNQSIKNKIQQLTKQNEQLIKDIEQVSNCQCSQNSQPVASTQINATLNSTPVAINPLHPFLPFFTVEGTTFTYVGEEKFTMLQGNIPITQKSNSKIRILKTAERLIKFGIIDSTYQRRDVEDQQFPNHIYYVGRSGRIFGSGKTLKLEGGGFKEGDVVQLNADAFSSRIDWKVNGKLNAFYDFQELSNSSIEWVPFVALLNNGDSIEWFD